MAEAPPSLGGHGAGYGTNATYRAVDTLGLPPRVACFLKGSEAVEAFWRGSTAEPPLAWLGTARPPSPSCRRGRASRPPTASYSARLPLGAPRWSGPFLSPTPSVDMRSLPPTAAQSSTTSALYCIDHN